MIDAKGPYFINDLKKVGLCIGGPRLDETRYIGMSRYIAELVVDHLNFGYREGRASRDGLLNALYTLRHEIGDEVLSFGCIRPFKQTVKDFVDSALADDEEGK